MSYVWNVVKRFKFNICNEVNQFPNDVDYINSCKSFISDFCKPIPFIYKQPQKLQLCHDSVYSNLDNTYLNSSISENELNSAIYSLKSNSAPGLDQISNTILKNLPKNFITKLLNLYNNILEKNVFPKKWKKYLILLIPKSNPGKVRPIALASCLLKCLENILIFRLSYYIEHNSLLSPIQFGFRKRRSCLDCLSILISEVYTAFMKNKFAVVVPLDIKGAFDNVNPNILLEDLSILNFPFKIRMFIFNLLTNRNVTFKLSRPAVPKSRIKRDNGNSRARARDGASMQNRCSIDLMTSRPEGEEAAILEFAIVEATRYIFPHRYFSLLSKKYSRYFADKLCDLESIIDQSP